MKRVLKLKLVLAGIVIVNLNLNAQDYHFSQFDALSPTYQPGLTGMFTDYKYKAATQYRNQWRPLANKPFSTFALSYEMPVDKRWGVGGYIINYDGAKVFNAFNMVVSGAYKITDPNQKEHLLTAGLQMGIIYRNTNAIDLLFENQYDNGDFNPVLPSNENFQRFSKLMPEFNIGGYYEWTDNNNKYHPYAGASVFHITSPKESFLENASDSRLPRRYLLHTGCKYDINEEIGLNAKLMYQTQRKAQELLMGLTGSYSFDKKNTDVSLGCYYRLKDAVSVITAVTYEDMTFGVSYDFTTSDLRNYNRGLGGLEFRLSYSPRN